MEYIHAVEKINFLHILNGYPGEAAPMHSESA